MFSSLTNPEQLSTTSKANVDAKLALFSLLSGKAFEGFEKMCELQLTAARASVDDSTAALKQ